MDVSVVILSYNNSRLVVDCVESLRRTTHAVSLEVILADNGSPRSVIEEIRNSLPDVILVENGTNLGFAVGNNRGLAKVTGRYVLLLNQDTIVLEGAVDRMVEYADQHPEAGVVGCMVLNEDRSLQRSCREFPSLSNMAIAAVGLHRLFPRSRFFGRELMTFWNGRDERHVDWITGCCMLIPADLLKSLGGLDPRFFYHFEEVDLCKRIWGIGRPVAYTPCASIIHLGGQSTKDAPLRFFLEKDRNCWKYFHKHHGMRAARWAMVILAVAYATRVFGWSTVLLATVGTHSRAKGKVRLAWNAFWAALRMAAARTPVLSQMGLLQETESPPVAAGAATR